ncbi:MAG: tRNA 2-thiouridine(34) synthase MnmA [Magnetococcus sp. WYHC-3]
MSEALPPIAVAMSGGVDSSAVAALLLSQGRRVIGLTMQLWDHGRSAPGGRTCCSLDDVQDARQVAAHLGIPFYVVNFESAFRDSVVDDFLRARAAGATPNPCVRCNQVLKFQLLLERALALGASHLATGHYARCERGDDGKPVLLRGLDTSKDQSYFLFSTPRDTLTRLLFPLGGLHKEQTRALAAQAGLHLASKGESQDLCFIPDGDSAAFAQRHLPPHTFAPGPIVDLQGRVLGTHQGLNHYTVGQRRGLGVAAAQPLYVLALQPATQTLVVGPHQALARNTLVAASCNWLDPRPPEDWQGVSAKIRYASPAAPVTLASQGEGCIAVRFAEPQYGIAPGQACVFYHGERVLGGGWIAAGECGNQA